MDEFDQHYFLYEHLDAYKEIPGHEHVIGQSVKTSSWQKSENLLKWVNKVSEEALEPSVLTGSDEAVSRRGFSVFSKNWQSSN